jgi:hypothetical protein
MKALISPNEVVRDPTIQNNSPIIGKRVVQVVEDGQEFPVGEPLFWIECLTTTNPGRSYYDPVEAVVKPFPPFPVVEQ